MTGRTALVLIMSAFTVFAGDLATMSDGGIQFAIDTAIFSLGQSDTLLLEVYQELDIAQLSRDEQDASVYTTEVTLEDMNGDTLAWDIWNTPVTWSEGGSAVNCTMLPVLVGSWKLTVSMTDVNNGRLGTAVREFEVTVPEHFSDIELARTIMPATEGSMSTLLKGASIVYPAASTRFVIPVESMVYTYQELYNLGGSTVLRQSQLLNANGVPVFARPPQELIIPEGMETVALMDSFDISVLREPGLYSLSVIFTEGSDTLNVIDKTMFVDVMEAAVAAQSSGFEGSQERRLDEFLLLLNQEDQQLFERLDVEAKELYYDNYWNARPGEHDPYLQRCRIVESRYGSLGRQGWESDRGRVFIIFGDPDEMESSPFSTTQAPTEVWFFYGTTQESFIFADLMGNGDYLQIYSTIEGEVSYSNWQNMIQNINSDIGDDQETF